MGQNPEYSLEDLQKEIGVIFSNKDYLKEALTHSSFIRHLPKDKQHNERLEFFGDSVLKFIVTEYLFHTYPDYNEGQLSKLRSQIISDKFLAEMAMKIDLGQYIFMSFGEQKSGGVLRKSMIANAMEALLGACYLDKGLEETKTLFFRLWEEVRDQLDSEEFNDFKTLLQEKCQKYKSKLPVYKVVKEIGPDHKKMFHVEASVTIDEMVVISQGDSDTKKRAEQMAAKKILDIVEQYQNK